MGLSVTAPESVSTQLNAQIDEAYAAMREGDHDRGLALFADIRSFAAEGELAAMTEGLYANFVANNEEERNAFRKAILGTAPGGATERQVIFSDSLGLPRPSQPLRVENGIHTNYSNALCDNYKRIHRRDNTPQRVVEPWCQRYATTEVVLGWLNAEQDAPDVEGADVVVHVGLNDFSTRMFLEKERLSLGLLPNELTQKIVRFTQSDHYRAKLVDGFSDHCFVKLDAFAENIQSIFTRLRAKGARSITYVGMIQLPMRVMSHTPNYYWNYNRYMNCLYQVCRDNQVALLDLSRHFWEYDFYACVLSDLMHLSPLGHVFLANRLTEATTGVRNYKALEEKARLYSNWINAS